MNPQYVNEKGGKNMKRKGLIIACYLVILISLTVTAGASSTDDKPIKITAPGEMVLVDGGVFTMGNTIDSDALPTRQVIVGSFYIGKYEVTFSEYDAYSKAMGKRQLADNGWGRGNQPVFGVSWFEAIEYCNWMSQKEGLNPAYAIKGKEVIFDSSANGYRLPTEAEWEYAAKGGNKSKGFKFSGSNDYDSVAWNGKNSKKTEKAYANTCGPQVFAQVEAIGSVSIQGCQQLYRTVYIPSVVGAKMPNELGIYDMTGNVSEWCWDWYDPQYYAKGDNENPTGPISGKLRVVRGGDVNDSSNIFTSQRRGRYPILSAAGFRIVRTGQ